MHTLAYIQYTYLCLTKHERFQHQKRSFRDPTAKPDAGSTLCLKKACDYIFCNNLNSECPIIIIFGTLINETICHRMVVSFPTSSI